MSREFLNERRVALEAAFFAEQDARLLQRLKAADEAKTKKEALAAASGIADGAVLDELRRQDWAPRSMRRASAVEGEGILCMSEPTPSITASRPRA